MNVKFGGAFACVACGEMLRIPDFCMKRILVVSFAVSLVALFIHGERWFALIGLAAFLFLPVSLIVGTVMRHPSVAARSSARPRRDQRSLVEFSLPPV
jgi:hypothetical protein